MKQVFVTVSILIGFPFAMVAFVAGSIWKGCVVGWRSVDHVIHGS